ncbi:unnamed protein product [Coregonus sp. 'balchen']|nr:unnamed protein product [Coregonus sp. 'balchen']
MHRLSSITSEDLEKRYQEDQSAVVKFTAGQQSYELSFRDNCDLLVLDGGACGMEVIEPTQGGGLGT